MTRARDSRRGFLLRLPPVAACESASATSASPPKPSTIPGRSNPTVTSSTPSRKSCAVSPRRSGATATSVALRRPRSAERAGSGRSAATAPRRRAPSGRWSTATRPRSSSPTSRFRLVIDPRTPVIVGVGQVSQRLEDPSQAREPIDLLADAARAADADTASRRSVLAALDTIAVVDIVSWKYPDPGALLGRRLGAQPHTTVTTTLGGNSPQLLVNELAAMVGRGEARAVLIGGGGGGVTRRRARRPAA